MKQRTLHSALIGAALTISAAGTSCRQQSEIAGQPAAAARSGEYGPEESFEFIVETFRRGVEDIPIGFVIHEAGGHSRMTGTNEVSHELIRPAKKDDRYRAVITVESQWNYSIQRSKEPDESDGDDPANEGAGNLSQSEASDAQILDPALVGTQDEGSRPASGNADNTDITVTRKAERQVRTYNLVYENGRWVLTTKLDPNTEKSIQYAFDRALETQS
jgi:hypothetical protein